MGFYQKFVQYIVLNIHSTISTCVWLEIFAYLCDALSSVYAPKRQGWVEEMLRQMLMMM
jgi:hypothetical protein